MALKKKMSAMKKKMSAMKKKMSTMKLFGKLMGSVYQKSKGFRKSRRGRVVQRAPLTYLPWSPPSSPPQPAKIVREHRIGYAGKIDLIIPHREYFDVIVIPYSTSVGGFLEILEVAEQRSIPVEEEEGSGWIHPPSRYEPPRYNPTWLDI